MEKNAPHYDLLIIGGGMVGASLACALGNQPLRIGVIEAVPFRSSSQPSYDDRSIALAYGARKIFEGMGLWPQVKAIATPINKIHVSDRGHFGAMRMDAAHQGYPALGYVVENRDLGQLFAKQLASFSNIELICPAQLKNLTITADDATVVIERDGEVETLTTRLIVGADGGRSAVRQLSGISHTSDDYHQNAVIANITPGRDHQHVAYERFTDSGPLALLPMSDGRCSLVWTVDRDKVDDVMAWDDETFLARLQERFGMRLGLLQKTGKRNAYPLALVRADEHIRPRLALIGNAAHVLHPIAGQGFNLGIRDVAALAQVIVEAKDNDIGALSVLNQYDQWRKHDQACVTNLTDGLVRIFSNQIAPLVIGRNSSLLAMDLIPPVKRALMRQTMGLAGKLPRLARGIPLQ
ncbi:MAG: 2-octaprenyl-6-methoxyphenyl hydroxylase [Gammaproteobacteria bacterium]|nr:2-octaprenyl-6-methoxyphenyl hydroxylase [Gammaproteobacteria bacterium]